ncbi:hypothetical protein [Patulibacter sp.]|uniref:hypothetical protein n=1 Tax=Patulibacter sp. TaxID=1912859 RepID=UPI00272755E2|nr:hypothetical protein [Patulibacter sp.]MDO9410462.1 hypothetical protein [Patulibacter sp.]
MHPRSIALGLTAAIAAAGLTACGGSDDDTTTTKAGATTAATVPSGKLNASAAPPALGYYGGIDCGSGSSSDCQEGFRAAREGYLTSCKDGSWRRGSPRSFVWERKGKEDVEFNYFCFTLRDKQTAAHFIYAGQTIVRSVHVSTDRFPLTEEAGWGVGGEWFSTTTVRGKVKNPNGVSSDWRAVHIGDL